MGIVLSFIGAILANTYLLGRFECYGEFKILCDGRQLRHDSAYELVKFLILNGTLASCTFLR